MLNHTSTLLESDYRDVLYGKLRAGFPSGSFDVSQAYSMLQQGRLPTSTSDTNAAKLEFLVSSNKFLLGCTEMVIWFFFFFFHDWIITSLFGELDDNLDSYIAQEDHYLSTVLVYQIQAWSTLTHCIMFWICCNMPFSYTPFQNIFFTSQFIYFFKYKIHKDGSQ